MHIGYGELDHDQYDRAIKCYPTGGCMPARFYNVQIQYVTMNENRNSDFLRIRQKWNKNNANKLDMLTPVTTM